MQTVPTANILLSFSPDPLNDILEGNADLSYVAKLAEIKDVLLFKNTHNNFLRMEHEFAFSDSGEGGGREAKITLEFIDPEQIFEERFLDISLSKIFRTPIELKEKLLLLENQEGVIGEEMIQLQNDIGSLSEEIENISFWDNSLDHIAGVAILNVFRGPTQKFDSTVKKQQLKDELESKQVELEALIKELDDAIFEKQLLQNQLQNKLSRRFWIMYGCGDDVSDWAGPFVTNYVGVTYNYDGKGVRKISLTFVSNFSQFRTSIGANYNTPQAYIEGRSKVEIEKVVKSTGINNTITFDSAGNPVGLENLPKFQDFTTDLNTEVFKLKNIHKSITRCLHNFLANSVGSNNVLVLLPNMDNILADNKQKVIDFVNNSLPFDEHLVLSNNDILTTKERNYLPKEQYELILSYLSIIEFFKGIGFEFSSNIFKDSVTDESFRTNLIIQKSEESKSFVERFQKILEEKNFYITLSAKREDPKKIIDNVFSQINEKSGGQLRQEYVWENNPGIIKLLKKYHRQDLDENSPLLIVGDQLLVQYFIYGDIDLDSVPTILSNEKLGTSPGISNIVNHAYIEEVKDFLYQKVGKKCFGKTLALPDQYAFTAEDKETIEKLNIPIFKSGVQDSNILNLTVRLDDIFFTALNTVYAFEGTERSSPSVRNELVLEPNLQSTLNVAEWMLNNWQTRNVEDIFKYAPEEIRVDPELLKPENTSTVEVLTGVFRLLLAMEKSYPGVITKISEYSQNSPYTLTLKSIMEAARLAFTASIKTLPLFNISEAAYLFTPSLMFVKEARVVNRKQSPLFGDVLNGVWNIFGFKHTISSSDVASYFSLTKDPSFAPLRLSTFAKSIVDSAEEYELINGN